MFSEINEDSGERPHAERYSQWSDDAIKCLIALYEEYESDIEDPKKKKKDVWKIITERMALKGYDYSQNKVESKWRTLVKAHKDIVDNKKKTGEGRKTFKYYDQLSELMSRRHDIFPPHVGGTGIHAGKTSTPGTGVETVTIDDLFGIGETNNTSQPTHTSGASASTDSEEVPSGLSTTKSAARKRKARSQSEPLQQALSFLKEAEQKREETRKQQVDLLKEIVSILKN